MRSTRWRFSNAADICKSRTSKGSRRSSRHARPASPAIEAEPPPGNHCIDLEPAVMPDIHIKALSASPEICAALGEMLIEAVANGGSVSFMHPLPPETANAFWRNSLAAAMRGERIVLGAFDGARLVGTVTLLLDLAQNQPHRAEIAKLMTRISHR